MAPQATAAGAGPRENARVQMAKDGESRACGAAAASFFLPGELFADRRRQFLRDYAVSPRVAGGSSRLQVLMPDASILRPLLHHAL